MEGVEVGLKWKSSPGDPQRMRAIERKERKMKVEPCVSLTVGVLTFQDEVFSFFSPSLLLIISILKNYHSFIHNKLFILVRVVEDSKLVLGTLGEVTSALHDTMHPNIYTFIHTLGPFIIHTQ